MSMSQSLATPSQLEQAFHPSPRGVVGLAEDLFQLCPEGGMEFTWETERCRVRILGTPERLVEVPLPKSVFRALLARMAALCNEQKTDSVSPYGGQGKVVTSQVPSVHFQVTFTNTPTEQKLLLVPRSS
jgi:hypothetical protein